MVPGYDLWIDSPSVFFLCLGLCGVLWVVYLRIRNKRHWVLNVLEAVLFGILIAIGGYLTIYFPTAMSSINGGNYGVDTSADISSTILSVVGLAITIITGVTIAVAMRALQDAGEAVEKAAAAKNALDEALAQTRERFESATQEAQKKFEAAIAQSAAKQSAAEYELQRLAAYQEVDAAFQFAKIIEQRPEVFLLDELVHLFVLRDIGQFLLRVETLLAQPATFQYAGPEGRRLFEMLDRRSDVTSVGKTVVRRALVLMDVQLRN